MRRNIFQKNFLLIFAIVSLYTFVIIFTVTFLNYKMYSQQYHYENQSFLNKASKSIDTKINAAIQQSLNISRKNSVQSYLNYSDSSLLYFPDIYDDIVDSLNSVDQLDLNIGISKMSDDSVVSQKGYFLLKDYLVDIGINPEELNSSLLFKKNKMNDIYFIKEKDNQNFTTIISKSYYRKANDYLFVFMSFPTNKLFPIALSNNSEGFFIANDQVISTHASTSNNSHDTDLLISTINKKLQSDSSKKQLIPKTINQNILYSTPSTSFKDMSYIYAVKKSSLLQYGLRTFSLSLFFICSLLLIGLLITYFATIKSYNPIRNILESLSKYKTNPANNYHKNHSLKYNELDFIIQEIDEMNKSNKELQRKMDDSLSTLQEEFITSVLYEDINEGELRQKMNELNLKEFSNGGTLSVLSLEGISREEENFSKNNLLVMRKKIIKTINNVTHGLSFLQASIDYKHICIIFTEKDKVEIYNQLSKMIHTLEMELSIDLTFSVSNPVETIFDFSSAFKEAFSLIQKKYTYMDKQIIFSHSLPLVHDDKYSYSLDQERFLINAIIDKDHEKARILIKDILDLNLYQLNLDTVNTIKFKYSILNTVKRILNYYDKSIKEFSQENKELFEVLSNNNNNDIYNSVHEIFEVIFNHYITTYKNLSDPITLSIIDYIDTYYTQEISLTDISEQFNLTEGYISKLLNKNANMSFKSYITNLKINKAKELLKSGKYKVSEVSSLIGYKNVNTFIRIFKKQEGIPPGEFSKLR